MALAIDSAPAASSLAPGFRFHPTDEELVRYYLRRKVCGKPFRFDAISDVDVYKVEPWDLPDLSKLKSRDLEWYFFSALDKKYGNGSRTNRATEKGYWKTTGKDRTVLHRSQQVGMKKTLVYHSGRAPKGERTNWVMHEYRLTDQELQKTGILKDAFILCRIFQKRGSGPKNGEKYGAPYIEEEWEDDETIFVPKKEDFIEELPVDMDSYLDANDILQILNTDMPVENGENMNKADIPTIVTNDPQPVLMVNQNDGSKSFDPPVQTGSTHGYAEEPNNTVNFDIDYLLDEPYFDATNDEFPLDESLFFEADDLENNVETDSGLDILNEYLSFFNTDMDNKNVLQDSFLTNDVNVNNGDYQLKESSQHFEGQNDKIAPSKQENPDQETDISSGFLKKASYMLGNISAPPAFASEYPTKYMASSSGPSTSVNGMIHISNVSFNGGAVDLSLGKHTQVNIVLSFRLGQREGNSVNSRQVEKVVNAGVSRSWFYSAFMWLLVLSLSFKIGSLVCSMS